MRQERPETVGLCFVCLQSFKGWGLRKWKPAQIADGANCLLQTKDKQRPLSNHCTTHQWLVYLANISLWNASSHPLRCQCNHLCSCERRHSLTVWASLHGLSYQCLTFVLVFDPQKSILFSFCGALCAAAGWMNWCAAEILSTVLFFFLKKEKGIYLWECK